MAEAASQQYTGECKLCGQRWEEHFVSFFHAATVVVVKEGVEPFPTEPAQVPPIERERPPQFTTLPSTYAGNGALIGMLVGMFSASVFVQWVESGHLSKVSWGLVGALVGAATCGTIGALVDRSKKRQAKK